MRDVFLLAVTVLCVDLRKQEDLVQSVRRRLEEALMADSLANVEYAAPDASEDKDEEKTEQVDKENL